MIKARKIISQCGSFYHLIHATAGSSRWSWYFRRGRSTGCSSLRLCHSPGKPFLSYSLCILEIWWNIVVVSIFVRVVTSSWTALLPSTRQSYSLFILQEYCALSYAVLVPTASLSMVSLYYWYALAVRYNFFNGWSGQSLYERWTLALYNVLFTLLPVIILGLFDRDVSDHMALRYVSYVSLTRTTTYSLLLLYSYPGLYATSRQQTQFNLWVFTGWLANSIFHSLVVVLAISFVHGEGVGDHTGQGQGLW